MVDLVLVVLGGVSMKAVQYFIAAIIIVFGTTACAQGCLKAKTTDVRHRLLAEIKQGDDAAKAREALKRVGATFSYDEFQSQYQAIIMDAGCGPYEAIEIIVRLDESGRVSTIDVSESYTYP